MKHTNGQWIFNKVLERLIVTSGKNGFVIAEVTCTGITHFIGNTEEAIANAKLIAAAPDLLKICEDILADDVNDNILLNEDRENLENAIRKATT